MHQNFICALLQDLFGIQARSFSALEHSYARDLFGLTEDEAEAYMKLAFTNDKKTMGVMIPGYVQLDVPWFFSTAEVRGQTDKKRPLVLSRLFSD